MHIYTMPQHLNCVISRFVLAAGCSHHASLKMGSWLCASSDAGLRCSRQDTQLHLILSRILFSAMGYNIQYYDCLYYDLAPLDVCEKKIVCITMDKVRYRKIQQWPMVALAPLVARDKKSIHIFLEFLSVTNT